ncbi:hypothetical protein Tco_0167335 [Tanacetum coccineum]
MDEMYRVTSSFQQGEVAAFSHSQKKHPRRGGNQKEETSQTSKRVILKTSKGQIGSQIEEMIKREDGTEGLNDHRSYKYEALEYLEIRDLEGPTEEGMFLGYKVNADRLKVCPDKADAVLSMPSPDAIKMYKS